MIVTSLMSQAFKSIYFADFPASTAKQKNLTLAFGSRDADLYKAIKPLSSHELRELLGHASFDSLHTAATTSGLNINPYCLSILRSQFADGFRIHRGDCVAAANLTGLNWDRGRGPRR